MFQLQIRDEVQYYPYGDGDYTKYYQSHIFQHLRYLTAIHPQKIKSHLDQSLYG